MLSDAADADIVTDAVVADTTAQEDNLWLLRDELTATRSFGGFGVKYDLAVPPDRIDAFLRTASDAVDHVLPGSLPYAFGHVGDGNLHFTVLRPGDDATLEAAADEHPGDDRSHRLGLRWHDQRRTRPRTGAP